MAVQIISCSLGFIRQYIMKFLSHFPPNLLIYPQDNIPFMSHRRCEVSEGRDENKTCSECDTLNLQAEDYKKNQEFKARKGPASGQVMRITKPLPRRP
ncbi:hypothetical protein B0H17DRAFT_1105843 [Mycena rosella]|uniref:Uncharacterized protein n=1 Tax=Mycena rosella TaxID=1033263 RepID=A0AAD7C655_MYCRO|nr:hypothetical protein B0H17DRAFT_1105843 [Mycena rosella]